MEVKVNIHTIQYNEYGEKNDIKVEATGTLYEKNDNTYVVYKEKENDVETKTTKLNINMEEEIIINVDYNIEIMDMFKGRNVIKIYIGK